MANRPSRAAGALVRVPSSPASVLDAGLDALDFGFAIFDRNLKLVASNKAFADLRGYPAALRTPGTDIIEFYRFNAERGDYGPGDAEAQAMSRMEQVRERQPRELEYELASGRILNIRYAPIPSGGLVLSYSDITERKLVERDVVRKEAELHVALENMPGALVYTDKDLNIVVRNDRFAEMYPVPGELLEPGRPYPNFLRYLAEHGYYGEGDIDALVARRVESLRNPTGVAFEDRTPDGQIYRIVRRKSAAGGTITVMTDITELKHAEENLSLHEAQLHVALDNMPGALIYTDEKLNIVVCNDRFAEMYPVPKELLKPGQPYPNFLRYLAEHGYYGEGDIDTLVSRRVESLRNPTGVAFEDRTPDGHVYRIVRRKSAAGGTVTAMTDITELKRTEEGLLEAKQRAEEANKLVTEQNRTLESLSSKLSKYLSPQLYKSIFSGEKNVDVTSQRKKLTIFFSDIAGFTETTDLLESEELTSLLNQYLREMSAIALEHGATIDKFIGDAIMLFFGDPETRGPKGDAVACVKMAIAMQQRMRDLQAEWRERGQEHVFQLRIGINTGFCTVGNFGSDSRVDYTIIGNEVNLAARLQSHADLGGILVAHETYALVKDEVLTEETGTITVKGFSRPVRTHRVVGLHDKTAAHGRIIRQAGRLPPDRRPEEADARSQGRRHPRAAGGCEAIAGLDGTRRAKLADYWPATLIERAGGGDMRRREFISLLGVATAWPFVLPGRAFSQQRTPLIGVLVSASAPHPFADLFRRGLQSLGYAEGRNIALEVRYTDGRSDRAAELAAELVRLKVDIIVAHFTPAVRAALGATSSIPIVMAPAGAPLQTGFIQSLARPGGNVTGLSAMDAEIGGRRVQLLRELIPDLKRIAVLATTTDTDPYSGPYVEDLRLASTRAGVRLQPVLISGPGEFENAFATMAKTEAQAVIVQPFFDPHTPTLLALAAKHRLAYMSANRAAVAAGGLVSISANFPLLYERAAGHVDKILKGANPAELPVEQPSKFQVIVNMKTAQALGLTASPSLLAQIDEVIE